MSASAPAELPSWPNTGEAAYNSRDHDMCLMAFQDARERSVDDWKALIKKTDSQLGLTAIHQPARYILGVIEATWNG
ncbi:uncharacterized protein BDV17DRAFT_251513 [Aspergillus undulatus]|uniref:uncharacterized protein n=1 Tax=Aspergillus undulatus TaxID=1810928 RepID=UPI003CCCB7CE